MAEKNVHSGHRKRLRDRAASEGLGAFNPHQVMELLLFYAIPRKDTSETAHLLINTFGSVHNALNAPEAELVKVPGIGKKTAEWLNDVGKLVQTYRELKATDRPKVINLKSASEFCEEQRGCCAAQTTYQLCTTPSGTIQIFTQICDSTAWGEANALRKSLETALAAKARSIVVVEYTDADNPVVDEYHRSSTKKYAMTYLLVGAELLDVILVGRQSVLSMSKTGDYDRNEYGGARSLLAENYLREDLELEPINEDEPDEDEDD